MYRRWRIFEGFSRRDEIYFDKIHRSSKSQGLILHVSLVCRRRRSRSFVRSPLSITRRRISVGNGDGDGRRTMYLIKVAKLLVRSFVLLS